MSAREVALSLKLSLAKRETKRVYSELLHNERLPRAEVDRLTDQRAIDIAAFAFDHTPFYRDLYTSAGISRADLRDPEAFGSLPVIDRSMIQENEPLLRSSEATEANLRTHHTTGSTGQPLTTYCDERVPLAPLAWRMNRWWGVAPSDDAAHIGRWDIPKRKKLAKRIAWLPSRVTLVSVGLLDQHAYGDMIAMLNQRRPKLIEGYHHVLVALANHVHNEGVYFRPPVALGSTSAPLTSEVRRFIESTLGAPVHDQYRCSEVPWMAGECGERNGLHVFADMRKIEAVDGQRTGRPVAQGTAGELVVTDLTNRVFPLVRYWLGDRGSIREGVCPCGVTLPLMDSPDGRNIDTLKLPGGTMVAGGLLGLFDEVPSAARQFRLHQDADYSVCLSVVPGPDPRAREQIDEVARRLRVRLEHRVPLRVELVDSMPYTGAKTKFVTSDVPVG
ncbi:MAG: phenylacetate--CoA ligase family protein [Marmoricola sp.]|nr:phenylacetate--CoA ligase family protein [Marmoricola sp.]